LPDFANANVGAAFAQLAEERQRFFFQAIHFVTDKFLS
jgi:hypothetical protein